MDRLDTYERLPNGMREYLSNYGWHFSKPLCEHAVSHMRNKEGKINPYTNEQVHQMLKSNGIELKNDIGYDACYVANMAKADYWGTIITSEQQIVKFVKDYIDDPDGYEGIPLTRYYADCIGSGHPLMWEEFI